MAASDPSRLAAEVRRALRRSGACSARELCETLGTSQPSVSRALIELRGQVLTFGRARATRYALRRAVPDVVAPISLYEVSRGPDQRPRHLADLHPIEPSGFYVQARTDDVRSAVHDDLPWFLHDLRPQGYLGRMVAREHAALGNPADVRLWTGDQVLRLLVRHGSDGVGAFIVGHEAYGAYVKQSLASPDGIPRSKRARRYADLAADAVRQGLPGSSAAGEQPKFLALREDDDGIVPVLVKFSPPVDNPVAERIADLLIAEHVALQAITAAGHSAAASDLVFGGDRVFLEVERFDRDGPNHRIGQVALEAVDAEFVGHLTSWTDAVQGLLAQGLASPHDLTTTRWLARFGELIANSDMHLGNLSFRLRGATLAGLAPAYDMGPAAYAPLNGELRAPPFAPDLPDVTDADLAADVIEAATGAWRAVARHPRVSVGFKAIASQNAAVVARLAEATRWLPG